MSAPLDPLMLFIVLLTAFYQCRSNASGFMSLTLLLREISALEDHKNGDFCRINRSVHINSHTTVEKMGVFCISVPLGWNQSEPMHTVSAGAGK